TQARAEAQCERGDIFEYKRLLQAVDGQGRRATPGRLEVADALGRLRPGDVFVVPGGKSGGRAVVLSTSRRRGGDVRLRALTPSRRELSVGPRDFPTVPRVRGRIQLPTPYEPRSPGFQRAAAEALGRASLHEGPPTATGTDGDGEAPVADHPVARCPDLRRHLRAAERAERAEREAARIERRIRGRTESLARQFDRVLRVLEAWGYVDGWALTDDGARLARIYHECDLLVAECLRGGLFDGLDPPSVASLASTFSYEQRGPGAAPAAWFPTPELRKRWSDVERLARELELAEDDAGLPLTRAPDPGF